MIRNIRGKIRLAGASGTAGVLLLLAACSGETASVSDDNESGSKTVSFAVVEGWDEAVATTYLWKELLEQRGYKVNVKSLDIASTFTAIANGQVDVYTDAWLPTTHESYWDRYGDKIEKISTWYDKADLNLSVPKYMKDVNTIDDLKGKQGKFGNRIIGIEPGSGLMKMSRTSVVPEYGLEDYELVEGSTAAMLSELESSLKAKKPVVVTLWRPHWAYTKYPIKPLKDTKGAYGEPDKTHAITGKDFAEKNPKILKWMSDFKLTTEQLGSLELLIQDKGKGKEQEAAKEWIAENKTLVDSWMK